MLRKHLETCPRRRELLEEDEPLDEEWEADIIKKTDIMKKNGGPKDKEKVIRQSSLWGLISDFVV